MAQNSINVNFEEMHAKVIETKDTSVDDDDGAMKFDDSFAWLEFIINLFLDDTIIIVSKMHNANDSIESLRLIWNDNNIPLSIKIKLWKAMLLNLLLWGS